MFVSLETLRRAVRFAGLLADLDDQAEFVAVALPALAELVGCDVLTYNEITIVPGQVSYADYPAGSLDPATRPIFAAHVGEHPLVRYYQATAGGGPVKISDFLSRQRFHHLGLYAEFFRNIPVEHQIAINLPVSRDRVIGIALNRSHTDFTETDRSLLDVLQAPLLASLRHARDRADKARALMTSGPDCLTDREAEVLKLVAMGRTDGAIARELDVSTRTIAKHLEHVYRKLGVANRAAAVSRFYGRCPRCGSVRH
jgi:DNA-binding CsgD family transcriptional regulator